MLTAEQLAAAGAANLSGCDVVAEDLITGKEATSEPVDPIQAETEKEEAKEAERVAKAKADRKADDDKRHALQEKLAKELLTSSRRDAGKS